MDTRSKLEQVEKLADRADYSGAWDELRSLESAGPFRTRVFDLRKRVQREMGLGQRFSLRVEEGGEYLVLTNDRIRLGNARATGNDLPVLANVSSHHAEIHRSFSFHGGIAYAVVPQDGKPVTCNGERVQEKRVLEDGDQLRFGEALEVRFRRPCARSQSARLDLLGGFDVQGVTQVLLVKPGAREGRIVFGKGEETHVRVNVATDLELYTDDEGQLRAQCSEPIRVDGEPSHSAEPVCPGGGFVQAGKVSFSVDSG